jgi:hypothetical protein
MTKENVERKQLIHGDRGRVIHHVTGAAPSPFDFAQGRLSLRMTMQNNELFWGQF